MATHLRRTPGGGDVCEDEGGDGGATDGDADGRIDVAGSVLDVAGGAAVVGSGTLAGMVLLLAGRALFTRTFTTAEYGVFSLSFTLVAILSVPGSLGLRNGLTRQIAFFGADGDAGGDADVDDGAVGTIILWGVTAAAVAGAVVGVALFLSAGTLATDVFGRPAYESGIRLAALGVPALALVRVCTAVFRGFSRTRERVGFQELLQKGTFPLLLAATAALGLGFVAGVAAYHASLALTAVAYVAYLAWANPAGFRDRVVSRFRRVDLGAELLRFSAPLMMSSLLVRVMAWTDVLMLGYFAPPSAVGLYDAVRPLVRIVPVIWGSMIFMYTPLVSELHADGDRGALRRVYVVVTKWFASATFPFILTFLLFPAATLSAVFGPAYAEATTALRLLAVAYFLGNLMGPNGATLTALGYTREVLAANVVAATANVALNVALIPEFGVTGAATATAAALVLRNGGRVLLLYYLAGVHSAHAPMLRPMTATALVAAGAYALGLPAAVTSGAGVAAGFLALASTYLASVVLGGDVGREDVRLLRAARDRARAVV
jgi:O-antigen/teichoic acid export membrane protein